MGFQVGLGGITVYSAAAAAEELAAQAQRPLVTRVALAVCTRHIAVGGMGEAEAGQHSRVVQVATVAAVAPSTEVVHPTLALAAMLYHMVKAEAPVLQEAREDQVIRGSFLFPTLKALRCV